MDPARRVGLVCGAGRAREWSRTGSEASATRTRTCSAGGAPWPPAPAGVTWDAEEEEEAEAVGARGMARGTGRRRVDEWSDARSDDRGGTVEGVAHVECRYPEREAARADQEHRGGVECWADGAGRAVAVHAVAAGTRAGVEEMAKSSGLMAELEWMVSPW